MAQTVATTPRHHFYQNNGELAAGGTLEIFDSNTVTHAVTWFERDGLAIHQNANPLTLDSQGAAVVWLEAGKVYDWVARDSLGNIIDNAKGITGSTSAVAALSQWVVTGLIPTFVNSRTFTLVGDQTAVYETGRRVRVTLSGGFKYATVISSVFSTVTTVTLAFSNGFDVLDATLSAVDVGLDMASSPFAQIGIGSVIDLTGYTGADVPIKIGQIASYSFASVTTLPLRIATETNQEYEIYVSLDTRSGATIAANNFLQPNNLPSFTGNLEVMYGQGTSALANTFSGSTAYNFDFGNAMYKAVMGLSTKTQSKNSISRFWANSASNTQTGIISTIWGDTTTQHVSLGTIQFNSAVSGTVNVKRIF